MKQYSLQVSIGPGTVMSPIRVTDMYVAHLAGMLAVPGSSSSPYPSSSSPPSLPTPPAISMILGPEPFVWPGPRSHVSLCRSPRGDQKQRDGCRLQFPYLFSSFLCSSTLPVLLISGSTPDTEATIFSRPSNQGSITT